MVSTRPGMVAGELAVSGGCLINFASVNPFDAFCK